MTIDQAYRFIKSVTNKDQRGGINPSEFNNLAITAQIETISDRLGNPKKLNDRLVPQYGYKANQKIQNELRQLLVGPTNLTVPSNGQASYPNDYFFLDSIFKTDFTPVTVLYSDEYPGVKKSLIYPPSADYPVAVFYGDHILVDPNNITPLRMSYIKYPTDPNWAYTTGGDGLPVYTSSGSVDFSVDKSLHLEICRKILKYVGVKLDSDLITQFAKIEEQEGA